MSTLVEGMLKVVIDPMSLTRGKSYARAGRVKSWDLAPDGKTMTAIVRGNSTYRQVIEFTWSAKGMLSDLSGYCSCPVGFNCKHVAAAILVADEAGALFRVTGESAHRNPSRQQAPLLNWKSPGSVSAGKHSAATRSQSGAAANTPSTPQAPALDKALTSWLTQYESQQSNSLRNAPLATAPNQYPSTVKDRIWYVISHEQDCVTILPMKVAVRKNGSIGARRATHYEFRNINQESPPKFILPVDLRIFRLLSLLRRDWIGKACIVSDDEEGQTLFRLVLDTGRAYWGDEYGLPLHADSPRKGQFVWRELGETQQLMVKADTAESDASTGSTERLARSEWLRPLPLVPAWYLDTETGSCGILQTDHPAHHVKWLASAPPVPASQADQMLAAMAQARIDLPRPKSVAQKWITDITPVPVLTLGTIKARSLDAGLFRIYSPPWQPDEIAPVLRLAFEYDGHRVAAERSDPIIQHMVDGQLLIIERQHESEDRFLASLVERAKDCEFYPVDWYNGLIDLADFKPQDLVLWPFDSANPLSSEGGGHQALDFVEDVVPALKAQGWQVTIDPTWPCQVYEGTPQISGGIQQQEGSWFSVGLNYEVEGQEFDLLPVLVDLVESISEDILENEQALLKALAGKRFVARLKDGRYTRFPIEPLIPALRFIRDLNQQMHAAQAGTISDLAQALAGCNIPFTCGQELLTLGARLRDLASRSTSPTELPDPPPNFKGDLRPYQKTGMAWMQALSDTGFGGILADDMGLGKTVQTLAFLTARRRGSKQGLLQSVDQSATTLETDSSRTQDLPCLLVVPTSLVSNWTREAARFVPDMSVLALHGPDRKQYFNQITQHDLIITTYPLLHRDNDILFAQDYDTVILDEAQHVKNPASQVAKLVRQIPSRNRLALTGTPMENNLEELWCLFDWLIPGLLGNRKSFGERFRKPIEKERNLMRQAALSKRISPFLMRRTKDQVVTDLPPRTEMTESVQLTGSQRALYETVRSTMHERVRQALAQKGLASSRITVLDALLKLRQACCDPQLVKLASAASITTSAKRARLMEMLESLVAEGRRVLVFSQFVEMLNLIEADIKASGWSYLILTGQTQKRGELVDAFQAGKASIFLISLKAGGVGLNLTAADTVILYDPWWNPAIERQAMDRVHRIGQDKPVFVHRLIAEGTVETRIAEMQARKQALMDSVFDPDTANTMDMSEDEILSLFAPVSN
ncbi:DEAD/DEAH box helicase [Orrella marina]|uniref:Helicase n=1 Tax=Orrella marina TaxID=2163011 RepID=A0A2R4XMQ0_9BURK|nr:DEAD/DEAH box helicase [Orrella marina]AWB35087.1 hypothetical protein DBV39_16630 [Orrella marina]